MDFNILIYQKLLESLHRQGFSFQPFVENIDKFKNHSIVMRHDVDSLPENSKKFSLIQVDHGIKGTYYFRIVPESFNEKIIKEIYELGHEIGYHYEDVSLTAKRLKAEGRGLKEEELVKIAIESFKDNLAKLREIVPIKTICMHGSPLSTWDSRLLWKYYDYHDFGIVGEPYFDIDFKEVMYLTDTGRRWDGDMFSVRDKPVGSSFAKATKFVRRSGLRPSKSEDKGWDDDSVNIRDKSINHKEHKEGTKDSKKGIQPATFPKFHTTFDIIHAAEEGRLPDKIMITFHPQRWTDKPVPWLKELVWQNVKNVGKYFLVRLREDG